MKEKTELREQKGKIVEILENTINFKFCFKGNS